MNERIPDNIICIDVSNMAEKNLKAINVLEGPQQTESTKMLNVCRQQVKRRLLIGEVVLGIRRAVR